MRPRLDIPRLSDHPDLVAQMAIELSRLPRIGGCTADCTKAKRQIEQKYQERAVQRHSVSKANRS